ncbi:hypothetical protein K438DRAFT_1757897 [Mycena galopus ATCC 62051]|nr:hypothetical protein K438DRAFT_1757897 [Mycena galopus ATCC 62051]
MTLPAINRNQRVEVFSNITHEINVPATSQPQPPATACPISHRVAPGGCRKLRTINRLGCHPTMCEIQPLEEPKPPATACPISHRVAPGGCRKLSITDRNSGKDPRIVAENQPENSRWRGAAAHPGWGRIWNGSYPVGLPASQPASLARRSNRVAAVFQAVRPLSGLG